MKKLVFLLIFGVLFSTSCAFQRGPRSYEDDYEIWFEKQTKDGMIKFETSPENALVYIIGEQSEEVIGTTPTSYKVKVTGKPYYFRFVKEGYYDYRFTVRPTPNNPVVSVGVELGRVIETASETKKEMNGEEVKNSKPLKYEDRIVGESSKKVEPKLDSRYN